MSEPLTCHLRFQSRETPVRRGEPVTVGLPWPKGAVTDDRQFQLLGPDGTPRVLQTHVLDHWPDGSVRWCHFDFLATINGQKDDYCVVAYPEIQTSAHHVNFLEEMPLSADGTHGEFAFGVSESGQFAFRDEPGLAMTRVSLSMRLADERHVKIGGREIESAVTGLVRKRFTFTSTLGVMPSELEFRPNLRAIWVVDTFPGVPAFRCTVSITNPAAADHPSGNWDLGNGGHVGLYDAVVRVAPARPLEPSRATYSLESGDAFLTTDGPVEVYQDSSGGENWEGTNHLNAKREIATAVRGYRVTTTGESKDGLRAEPIVCREREGRFLGVVPADFWQKFPQSVETKATSIELGLFPSRSKGTHELQGGEQKTHTFYVAFGKDDITDEPMVWCRSPLLCHADPEWYAASGAIPYLTPKSSDPNDTYLSLVDQAIEGPDTFVHKREKIDEYGWRHFGDIYGDHEAVKHTGPTPLISHYNNQYDCVQGFLAQFMRSGDRRWLDQGFQCADHTCDIDIYHTTKDKPAYNGGLFWHTYHYVDADTGTHRSYPKSLRKGPNVNQTERVEQLDKTADKLQKAYAVGGGPSASHNYNLGLMTAYFLTGNPQYRDTAIDLARFVIRMEDPAGTPFRFLSREFTGLATDSGGGGYHGPGRASANSILALVVGHRLMAEKAFLDKAEQLIRRVCHPNQNLEKLDLLNAELRWFYTMHLQALGVYLDHKIELGQLDEMYAYARLTLLHYATWMAANERPILDTPEKLQFPTETWCAQDMRKVEVFQFAAKHATGEEKAKFLERAEWFFRYVERTLPTFTTKSLCRPVVLMMKYGWSRNWWTQNPEASAPEPTVPAQDWGTWRMFVPQRAIAVKRAKRILVLGAAVGCAFVAAAAIWFFKN